MKEKAKAPEKEMGKGEARIQANGVRRQRKMGEEKMQAREMKARGRKRRKRHAMKTRALHRADRIH